jgi:hypothetical protein
MGGQDHVAAAFQHPELVSQRPRGPAQIRLGDDVENHLAWGGHLDQLGAEWPDPPADAQIDRARTGDQPDIAGRGHPGAHGRVAEQSTDGTGHEQAPWLRPRIGRRRSDHCGVPADGPSDGGPNVW